MIGQAFIKAIQFAVNEVTFLWLEQHSTIQSNILKMAIAGILAGLLSSFVVSPVELVKIRMQTQNKLFMNNKKDDDIILDSTSQHMMIYKNELDCAQSMIRNEGWRVLFFHGLGTTIIREIPSFALYFVTYGLLAQSAWKDVFGRNMSPLIFGAVAGWAMWIPTYPIDIVKTLVQVQTTKKENALDLRSPMRVTKNMYRAGGIRAFFDGLEPKLARAAVKHAVTFWVYQILMTYFRTRSSS
jgi:solute carrier family 25 carnitine/acylcarnitine transporter 20/29